MEPTDKDLPERPGHYPPPSAASSSSASDYYHALFHRMDQAFCVLELLFDDTGQTVVDCIYRQVNPVFSQQSGLSGDVVGRSGLDVMPDLERFWFDVYGRVARTGESERLEQYVPPVGCWFDVHTFRIGGPGSREVGVLFHDITARNQAAAAAAFRLRLADALGPLSDPVAIQEAVTHLARQHFAADRCFYVEIEDGQGLLRRDAAADGLPSMAGTYPYADFALLQAVFEAGQPFGVRDVRQDASVDENLRRLCVQLQVISYLSVPLLKHGQPVGVLCLAQRQPRDWTAAELVLAAEVAERAWAAVERAGAEEALRESEVRRDLALETAELGTYVWHAREDRTEADARLLALFGRSEETQATFAYMLDQGLHPDDRAAYVDVISRAMDPAGDGRLQLDFRVVHPDQSVHWMASTGQALFAGQPRQAVRIIGTVADITERKQAEERQAFLLRFSDALRAETSPTGVAHQALGLLCEQLRLDRCYVGVYDLEGDRGIFPYQVGNDRIPPVPDEVRLSDFPDALRVASDQTLVIDDLAHTAGLSDTDRQNLGALGMRALVAASLRRGPAGPLWSIVALSADVRHWTPGEVALLEEATERTWAAMERARAEEALQASQATLATVFEALPMGVGVMDTQGRLTLANPQMQQYLPTGRMPSQDPTQYARWWAYHPDGRLLPRSEYPGARALRGEKVLPGLEMLHTQEDGREVWTQVSAVPLPDHDGHVSGHVTVILDIDATKRAEEALRHTEERYRAELEQQVAARTQELQESRHLLQTVFDASPTAIVVLRLLRDAAGQAEDFEILIFNEFNRQVVGRDDLVGQRFTAMFPNTVPTGTLARLLQVATTGEPADFEQWYEGEGMRHWFRHIMVRQDGLLVLTSEVITARKTAEQERARTLRLLEQAEAVAGLGSWDYDRLNQEFRWSEGMYQLFGLPVGQLVHPDIYRQYVVDEDRIIAENLVHRVQTGDGTFEETLRLRVGKQVKTVRIKFVVLHSDSGAPVRVLGVDLDISQLQRLEADNLRLRLGQQQVLFEAVQAAQEAERKRMAESLHNGIGQMLYATKLRIDQLHAPLLGTNPALVAARNEADRLLAEAIRQTRALSHELVPMALEKFGLAASLHDIGTSMSTPQLHFHCHAQFDEDTVLLPPALQMALYRMAQELAQNIAKHATGATTARLEVETTPGWALLRAEDDGKGFTSPPDETHGLGLRSIRDRVDLLGGQMTLGSNPAGGAYVRIRIPLLAAAGP